MGVLQLISKSISKRLIEGLSILSYYEETTFDTPIEPDCYLVFFNGSSNIDDDYYFLGVTNGLIYTHFSVGRYSQWMFYRVMAYKDFTGNRGDRVLSRLSRNLTEAEVIGILSTK